MGVGRTNAGGTIPDEWTPKPFYECSVSDMVKMVQMHYNDELDINDWWNVGDTSEAAPIEISAISDATVSDVYPNQRIRVRIIGIEHDNLTTPINGHTKACVTLEFINSFGDSSGYYIWGASTNIPYASTWEDCPRKTWLDTTVLMAFPRVLANAIVDVNKVCAVKWSDADTFIVTSKIFLLSEYEVYGQVNTSPYGSCKAQEGECYAWYGLNQNPSNIKLGDVYNLSPGSEAKPWLRTPGYGTGSAAWCLRYFPSRVGTQYGYDRTGSIRPAFCL